MKKTLKAVLLWGTALSTLAFLEGGVESLLVQSMWIETVLWLCANITGIIVCMEYLTYKDAYALSGARWTLWFLNKYVFKDY